jgi:hypothetical protein
MKPLLLKESSDDWAIAGAFAGDASASGVSKGTREAIIAKNGRVNTRILYTLFIFCC